MRETERLLCRDERMKESLELLKRAEIAMLKANDINDESSDQYLIRQVIAEIRDAMDDIESIVGK